MRLLKEQQSFSLSVAIQNSILIIPYSQEFVQGFYGARKKVLRWLNGEKSASDVRGTSRVRAREGVVVPGN